MALTAQSIGLSKFNWSTVCKVKYVSVFGVMAIQTPSVLFIVMKFDIGVESNLMRNLVDLCARLVALRIGTRKNSFC